MTSYIVIGLVALTHFFVRVSFFFHPENESSIGPALAGNLVFLGLLDLMYDFEILPKRYNGLPSYMRVFFEYIIALILAELGIFVFWCSIERTIHILMKVMFIKCGMRKSTFEYYESGFVGAITLPISMIFIAFVGHATDHFHFLHQRCVKLQYKATLRPENFWKYLFLDNREQQEMLDTSLRRKQAFDRGNKSTWRSYFQKAERVFSESQEK